jgi:hypothetical protein
MRMETASAAEPAEACVRFASANGRGEWVCIQIQSMCDEQNDGDRVGPVWCRLRLKMCEL